MKYRNNPFRMNRPDKAEILATRALRNKTIRRDIPPIQRYLNTMASHARQASKHKSMFCAVTARGIVFVTASPSYLASEARMRQLLESEKQITNTFKPFIRPQYRIVNFGITK